MGYYFFILNSIKEVMH